MLFEGTMSTAKALKSTCGLTCTFEPPEVAFVSRQTASIPKLYNEVTLTPT